MSTFPTKQKPQLCKNGCGTKIYLSDKKEKGKWLPYDPDDTVHDCPNWMPYDYSVDELASGNIQPQPEPQQETIKDITGQPGQKEPTIAQLKNWIAKLEKNGIHIDINSILNPKQKQQK